MRSRITRNRVQVGRRLSNAFGHLRPATLMSVGKRDFIHWTASTRMLSDGRQKSILGRSTMKKVLWLRSEPDHSILYGFHRMEAIQKLFGHDFFCSWPGKDLKSKIFCYNSISSFFLALSNWAQQIECALIAADHLLILRRRKKDQKKSNFLSFRTPKSF